MANYLQAESGINNAKSVVLKAQADFDRTKDLFEHSAVAQKEVTNAESALAQAKAALEVAMTTREQTQRKLDMLGLVRGQFGQKVAVKAPISGKILELTVAANEFKNDTNASLMTIADLSTVWVSSDVPETQIRFIDLGERVDLALEAYPGKEFHAKVMRIADTVDPTTRTIKVHAELANPGQQLRPEMFGRIRQIESVRKGPVVPLSAVVQNDGSDFVYRETGKGTYQRVRVKLGQRISDRVAVLEGLNAGDRIVVDGVMLLKAS
jgi:cobalt-zinc-cadmium efflux system membrane fusion protein